MNRIITISDITIDLEKIKVIKISPLSSQDIKFVLTIEYNSRIVYSKNPLSEKVEQTKLVDTITKDFENLQMAQLFQQKIEESWNTYLNEKQKRSLSAVGEF